MVYLDFDIDLREHDGLHYQISARAPVGESNALVAFPFTDAALENHLLRLENAILRSSGRRRKPQTEEERTLQTFGQQLFDFLLHGDVRTLYYECLGLAHHRQQGVRLRLHIQPPALAVLPWEFLYDSRRSDYVCLDPFTPLVRYLDLPQRIQPLPVSPPLRILGMVANPSDLQRLNVDAEKAKLARALHDLIQRGLVELTWLTGETKHDLQRAMRTTAGPWHIFHFIGHGGFDATRGEGVLLLVDEQRRSQAMSATQLSRLLAGQRYALRLVVLNACEGARGGHEDILSSTAATLVQNGLPAVLAMQYDITDIAAVELAQSFYEAIADGQPVDTAVTDARNAVSLANEHSLEWGTPVLYMRAPDGWLFDVAPAGQRRLVPAEPTVARLPVEFEWVHIPGGAFLMGSDKKTDKEAQDNELPQHSVTVADFKITKVPVTNAQYKQFVDAKAYQPPDYWQNGKIPVGKEDHPVVRVNWQDALAFCSWAIDVQKAAGQHIVIRLPTEAEWEKAARGTDGRLWPWGSEPPNEEQCNFAMNVGDTTSVKRYPTGMHGLYDMAGNVWEWTSSLFKPYPYKADDGREEGAADVGRVVRGGSFVFNRYFVRCAYRYYYGIPDYRSDFIGFRVVSPGS